MYRTDKKFMRDPATASSRIYIGNLAETIVPDNLEETFKVYGKVLGLVLQRGFGFLQFETEAQARAAIEAEHGTIFHGRKMIVREVLEHKGKKPNGDQNNTNIQPPPILVQSQKNVLQPPNKPNKIESPTPIQPTEGEMSPGDKRGNKRKFWPRNERPAEPFRYNVKYYKFLIHDG